MLDFFRSDYLERDPYRKFTVGLAHSFGGDLLIMAGWPLWLVVAGYLAKELVFDVSRVFVLNRQSLWARGWPERALVADSAVDWAFWGFGAAMAYYQAPEWGFSALALASFYFVIFRKTDGE